MGLRIQNNISALNTHRNLVKNDNAVSQSLQRLSSGFRINKAADDAAGLSVSMGFRAQIKSLRQASRNASEAASLLQVAEGAADQITNILTRMKELATQAASSNTTSADRTNIGTEINTLESEITRIATSTKYGTTSLVDGSFGTTGVSVYGALATAQDISSVDVTSATPNTTYSVTITTTNTSKIMSIGNEAGTTQFITTTADSIGAGETATLNFDNLGISLVVDSAYDVTTGGVVATGSMITEYLGNSQFQIGSENESDNQISFSLGNMTTDGLSVDVTAESQSGAQSALTSIDAAITSLASNRATIGVAQNRLGFASANIAASVENLSSAESVIRDADMAFETVDFTKNQILIQAGTAMLSQANLLPQAVLSLIT